MMNVWHPCPAAPPQPKRESIRVVNAPRFPVSVSWFVRHTALWLGTVCVYWRFWQGIDPIAAERPGILPGAWERLEVYLLLVGTLATVGYLVVVWLLRKFLRLVCNAVAFVADPVR